MNANITLDDYKEFMSAIDGSLTAEERKRLWELIGDITERRLREKFGDDQ